MIIFAIYHFSTTSLFSSINLRLLFKIIAVLAWIDAELLFVVRWRCRYPVAGIDNYCIVGPCQAAVLTMYR